MYAYNNPARFRHTEMNKNKNFNYTVALNAEIIIDLIALR